MLVRIPCLSSNEFPSFQYVFENSFPLQTFKVFDKAIADAGQEDLFAKNLCSKNAKHV